MVPDMYTASSPALGPEYLLPILYRAANITSRKIQIDRSERAYMPEVAG